MEITLEKIELVKEKTGVSYKEAKAALENANGSVVDAIVSLESMSEVNDDSTVGNVGQNILNALKETVAKGNASRVRITNEDGEPILSIPVSIGLVGAFITPWGFIIATAASFGFKCNIEIVKTDGTIVDVSGTAKDGVNVVVEKSYTAADTVKTKSKDVVDKVKGSTVYDKVVTSEVYDKIKEKTEIVTKRGERQMEEFAEDFMAEEAEEEPIKSTKKKTTKKKDEK